MKPLPYYSLSLLLLLLISACQSQPATPEVLNSAPPRPAHNNISAYDTTKRSIHIYVAMCDNKYQGIVPVSARMGNGQDPENNLYWGNGYGVRTYFKKSSEWKLLRKDKIDSMIMERLVFKHATKNYYLIAEAYNGKDIQQCTKDFLLSASGQIKDTLQVDNTVIGTAGNASVVTYVGHNGLMDFQLTESYANADGKTRDCIILACASRNYFTNYLKQAKAKPLLWTTNLMGPEAYTLHDALTAYVNDQSDETVRSNAAKAYSKYQGCSEKAARGLLVTGW